MNKEDFKLRKATRADIPAIMALEAACFAEDGFTKSQFDYLICRAKGWFYVVTYQSQIAGYLSLLSNARTQYLRIYSIAVGNGFRGYGLGQRLMEETLKTAQEQGMRKITLEVNIANQPAIALYKKNGFSTLSVKKKYYHDGTDALYMQKALL